MAHAVQIEWLGSVAYAAALERQLAAVEARRAGGPDRLLLLEHPSVITLGRSSRVQNVRTSPALLAARGIELHEVARGGDVTWHGPGQLVGYLIADLAVRGQKDASAWLRGIEGALIEALAELGVACGRRPGMTGVFVEGVAPPRKIASIGVGLKHWISYHGFALNVTADLAGFDDIVPCGLDGVAMTSLARELGVHPERALFERAREAVARAFERALA